MTNSDVISVLSIFKKSRELLISRTIEQSPDFYRGLFDYEENSSALSLLFEKEKTIFINHHFDQIDEISKSKTTFYFFKTGVEKLFSSLSNGESVTIESEQFIQRMSEKLSILDSLLKIENKSENGLNTLRYHMSRDSRIFEREISKLTNNTK
ncbi:hypothetical protein [Serratia oryzae]|uniref:Uncharacterized protein n=1 Tax=Serratia oryzae TaxID=2034155 RepID=A0A1S8CP01_9GAMM|nr:hypothetical protein [Serratia oryzae]OMQ24735.1 hypothetical protein BMI79_07905 [Serratia oryzae]